MDIPAQAIVAIATIIAALIAGLISFVNLTLSKEQKTSEFRQAWIDALIEDLSGFFSAVSAVARADAAVYANGDNFSKTNRSSDAEQIAEQRLIAMQTLYRIKIRLNPNEVEHTELLRLLDRAIEELKKISEANPNSIKTIDAIDLAADFARPVLKAEWKRVKSGELPFRIARNWVAPILVILCLGFIAFLLAVKFKI